MKIIYRLTTMEFGCESTRNGRKESVSDYKLSLKVVTGLARCPVAWSSPQARTVIRNTEKSWKIVGDCRRWCNSCLRRYCHIGHHVATTPDMYIKKPSSRR